MPSDNLASSCSVLQRTPYQHPWFCRGEAWEIFYFPGVLGLTLSTEPLSLGGDQAPEHFDVGGDPTALIWGLGTWKGLELGWHLQKAAAKGTLW